MNDHLTIVVHDPTDTVAQAEAWQRLLEGLLHEWDDPDSPSYGDDWSMQWN